MKISRKGSITIPQIITLVLVTLGFVTIHAQINPNGNQASEKKIEADNTGVNKRDRADHKLTADSQAKASREDEEITRRVREELTRNDDLSSYGQNVKIITMNGVVTLRGPVKTQQERDWIVGAAQKVSGVRTIQNELEVKK